jgi:hypothetical protein
MFLTGITRGQQVNARLVVHAGVEVNIVEQVVLEQRLFQLLCQACGNDPSGKALRRRHGE